MKDRGGSWISFAAVVVFLLLWEAVCQLGWVSRVLLSPPSRIITAGWRLLGTPDVGRDLLFTLVTFLASVATAIIGGLAVGIAIGYSSIAYRVVNPFIVAVNSLPKVVLMPLIVLWLGIGMSANVCLGGLMASFPITISTYTGIRSIERDFVLLARSFRAGTVMTLRSIVLPGILPYVLSGLRVGINYAMVGVLLAEFFASDRGIGYRIVLYMSNFEVDAFFACLALVAAFGIGCTGVVHWIERRVEAWRPAVFEQPEGM